MADSGDLVKEAQAVQDLVGAFLSDIVDNVVRHDEGEIVTREATSGIDQKEGCGDWQKRFEEMSTNAEDTERKLGIETDESHNVGNTIEKSVEQKVSSIDATDQNSVVEEESVTKPSSSTLHDSLPKQDIRFGVYQALAVSIPTAVTMVPRACTAGQNALCPKLLVTENMKDQIQNSGKDNKNFFKMLKPKKQIRKETKRDNGNLKQDVSDNLPTCANEQTDCRNYQSVVGALKATITSSTFTVPQAAECTAAEDDQSSGNIGNEASVALARESDVTAEEVEQIVDKRQKIKNKTNTNRILSLFRKRGKYDVKTAEVDEGIDSTILTGVTVKSDDDGCVSGADVDAKLKDKHTNFGRRLRMDLSCCRKGQYRPNL